MNNFIKSFNINIEQKELLNKKYSNFLVEKDNKYIESFFQTSDWSITIYKSQKAVISGKNIDKIVEFLNLKENLNSEIGMDEVGVGDYFGGIVVCSVYLTNVDYEKIAHLDIKDSKKLTDEKISKIAIELIRLIKFEVSQVFPNEYNYLFDKFHNTHIIKTLLHNNALYNLINKNKIINTPIILDQYVSKENYYKYLEIANIKNVINIDKFETKAETKHLSVACASIIARYYFLEQIKTLSKQININLPLGAWNNKVEEVTKLLIHKYGIDSLNKYVKFHFKNTQKLL